MYNRVAISFVHKNEKYIDRERAAKMIKCSLDVEARNDNEKIYKMLTTCKISVLLLDRFKTDLKFVKTIINKLLDISKEINRMEQHKKLINCGRVLLNISSDCKEKISQLITDEELLRLANSLPTAS